MVGVLVETLELGDAIRHSGDDHRAPVVWVHTGSDPAVALLAGQDPGERGRVDPGPGDQAAGGQPTVMDDDIEDVEVTRVHPGRGSSPCSLNPEEYLDRGRFT